MTHRISTARRIAGFAVIAILPPLVGVQSAAAAPTAVCSTTDPAFCASYSIAIDSPGTSTPVTAAAAPADFTFGFANTSEAHATDTSVWLDHVAISLADGLGPVTTPSSDLDNNLLIAGSSSHCGTNAGDFTSCTGGYGTFYADVSGTTSDDGIHSGTFGIERIVNSHATSGAALDWSMTVDFCLVTTAGPCNAGTPLEQTVELASGAQAAGTIVLPTYSSFDVPLSGTVTAHIDSAIDSLQGVHLLGASNKLGSGSAAPSGTQTVLHLPYFCGTASTSATMTDRSSDSATIPGTLIIDSCPTARLTSTSKPISTVQFHGNTSTTPLSPNRTIKRWFWFFGDGHKKITTSPTVSHTYATSRDRTVALVVQDSLGAFSNVKALTLFGAKLTLNASRSTINRGQSVKLSGRLRHWHSTTNLPGKKVSLLKCNAHGRKCHVIATRTTSSGGAFSLKAKPTHTSVYEARFVHNGYIGTIAKRKVRVLNAVSTGLPASG